VGGKYCRPLRSQFHSEKEKEPERREEKRFRSKVGNSGAFRILNLREGVTPDA